eukprot:5222944-Pyramimonas_sp.AAC.1
MKGVPPTLEGSSFKRLVSACALHFPNLAGRAQRLYGEYLRDLETEYKQSLQVCFASFPATLRASKWLLLWADHTGMDLKGYSVDLKGYSVDHAALSDGDV